MLILKWMHFFQFLYYGNIENSLFYKPTHGRSDVILKTTVCCQFWNTLSYYNKMTCRPFKGRVCSFSLKKKDFNKVILRNWHLWASIHVPCLDLTLLEVHGSLQLHTVNNYEIFTNRAKLYTQNYSRFLCKQLSDQMPGSISWKSCCRSKRCEPKSSIITYIKSNCTYIVTFCFYSFHAQQLLNK